ncbi:copper-binding protein [Poriferisphaera sp. WC338]|uniref:copper-binding protein n=1 Tax=Poriferisphaera sp. WC338 TaxID=3425129 RepID=UPI003D819977
MVKLTGLNLCLGAVLMAGGCGSEADQAEVHSAGAKAVVASAPIATETYTVRGELVEMKDAKGRIKVKHEAIPTFKSKKGDVVGMNSMTMLFPVGEGVLLDSYAKGNKIEMKMVVDWNTTGVYYISEIKKLPADTKLAFGGMSADAHVGHDHAAGEHKTEGGEHAGHDGDAHSKDEHAGHDHDKAVTEKDEHAGHNH